jgi:NADPH:quinone reductase-like Zn-dependent oxidoreductase
MNTIKAVAYSEYGGPEVLHVKELAEPVIQAKEMLVRVHAAGVNYGDAAARDFKHLTPKKFNMPLIFWLLAKVDFGINRPKREILGSMFSGTIEKVGDEVDKFKSGEQVFGYLGQKMGAYAQKIAVSQDDIVALKPSNMTYEQAAIVPYGALMALLLLKKSGITPGKKILIIGASGGIGSAAVQLANNYYGAEVTGVCGTSNVEFVRSLGAGEVIDYQIKDYTGGGNRYDIILDILGKGSFSAARSVLTKNGTYLSASFKFRKLLQMIATSISGGKRLKCAIVTPVQKDLVAIKNLVEEGTIKPMTFKSFELTEASKAHGYFESGQRNGATVISFAN